MKFTQEIFCVRNATIRNKKAREITYVKDADQMKRILQKMVEKDLIEPVLGTRGGGASYRKKEGHTN